MEAKKRARIFQILCVFPLELGRWMGFTCAVIKSLSWKKSLLRSISIQGYDIGVASLPVVMLTGAVTGIVLALQSYYQLGIHGLSCAIGFFVVKSILVEIGPVLTALALSGRVGGAISAFLGTMRMTEQVSAMETLGVNPLEYFALPRIIAGIIAMPALVIAAVWSGIFCGYLLCRYAFQLPAQVYLHMVSGNVFISDIVMVIVKSLVFGFIITSLACYQGLGKHCRITDVAKVTTAGVVTSYISILFANCVITAFFHVLGY
ncbi:MlaE family ABC transporter permease [Chlamydia buteonis]|uniref:ABC transporter permease n=1 Tax=Chlamydia buteonis TaxID=2494525 RepID=A0ABX8LE99_9CHLA|nr:ABC transporter permease [Chlamydia buteonis]QXE27498.1 ABC transporter permease [Chlamydia buteonis]QXE28357.1 ABC transporter permease [Chlamydia buteonis]